METEQLTPAALDQLVNLRRKYNHPQEEGDVTLGIEYLAAHGRAMEYFWITPGPAFREDPRLEGRELESVKLFQKDDGSWELQLRGKESQDPLPWAFQEEQLEELLAGAGEKLYARVPKGQEWHPAEE